jgi:hypothetical protein
LASIRGSPPLCVTAEMTGKNGNELDVATCQTPG